MITGRSINQTIRLLAVVLEQAVEYGYLDRNPAKGRKRLLKKDKPTRTYLQPDQVAALLGAAGKIDADAREGDTRRRRPLLATLTLAACGPARRLIWPAGREPRRAPPAGRGGED